MSPYVGIVVTIVIAGVTQVGVLLFYLGGDKRVREDHDRQLLDHETRLRDTNDRLLVVETHCKAEACR